MIAFVLMGMMALLMGSYAEREWDALTGELLMFVGLITVSAAIWVEMLS